MINVHGDVDVVDDDCIFVDVSVIDDDADVDDYVVEFWCYV
jgi:hypothetical protein